MLPTPDSRATGAILAQVAPVPVRVAHWLWFGCTLVAGSISLFSLWVWQRGDWSLAAWDDQTIPVAPSTALLLLLLTVALGLRQRSAGRLMVRFLDLVATAVTAVAAVAVIVQSFAGLEPRWEQWLASSRATVRGIPVGQMSPFTAVIFLLAALSLTALQNVGPRRRALWRAGKFAALFGGAFCTITALAYATGTPLFYGGGVVPMAFLTAVAFIALNLALLIAGHLGQAANGSLGRAPQPDRMTLGAREQRLIFGLTTAAFASVAFAGPFFLRSQQTSLKHGIAAELTAIATLKVRQISAWRAERLWDARRLMHMPSLARGLAALAANPQDSALHADLSAWMAEMNSTQDVDAIVLFDREMKPRLASPVSVDVSSPRLRALLGAVPRARDVLEADIHRSTAGAIYADLLVPILDEHQPPAVGAILLRINPEKLLYPLLLSWPVPSATAESCLFRREGRELVYLNKLRHHPGAALTVRSSVDDPQLLCAKIARGETGAIVEGMDDRGVPVLGVGLPVPGTGWFLMAKKDRAEAYGPLQKKALMVLVATIAILCAVALGGVLLWRQRQHARLEREFEAERERSALAARLALVMRHANDMILLMDADGRILEANDRALASYGYTLDELMQLPPGGLRVPADAASAALDDSSSPPVGGVFEKIHRRKDGSLFPVEASCSTLEANGRRFRLGIYRDISQRKAHEEQIARLTRLYSALSHINQTIIRTRERKELFDAICRILVEFGRFRKAWIGWHEAGSDLIVPVASFGDTDGELREIRIRGDDRPEDGDPARLALLEGRTAVGHDPLRDPDTAVLRKNAAGHSSPASIALPIRRSGRVVGVLTVSATRASILGDNEITLLEEAATDVSFALDNIDREVLREQAKAALRQSEEEHRLLFLNHPIPTWVYDTHSLQFLAVNNAAMSHYGYTREDFLAMTIKDIRPDSEVPAVLEEAADNTVCRRRSGPRRHRKKNGEVILVEISSEPVSLEGRPARLVLAEDITLRQQAEEELKQSEERYRSLFANLVEGFAYCRMIFEHGQPADFIYLEVNPAFSTLTGLKNVVGRRVSEIIPGIRESDPELFVRYGRVALTGRSERFETYVASLKMWFDISVYRPAPDCFVAVFDVITGRKDSERRLREQAELLDKANDAIVVSDLENRITFLNQAAARLFGWSAAEMIGRPWGEVFPPGDGRSGAEIGSPGAAAGHPRRRIRGHNRNGAPLVIETSVTVLRDESGRATGQLSISTDATEKEKLEEKFLRAQRLESIGMLAAGISHDLNNLLAPIGMVSTLLRHRHSESSDEHLLDTLDKCAARGAGLVRQILGFVHGIGGEPRIVQIRHLLRDIVEVITETYPKSIVLEEKIPGDLWPILANPTQIHQVLLNLCVNARDAMPGGGTLRLLAENRALDAESVRDLEACDVGRSARPGQWLVLHIEDTGTGIPPESLARIWEPFFTTKPAGKGTGLGLATVRGIVEAHHGFLTLQTERGRGSTFRVYLPAAAPAAIDGAPPGSKTARHGRNELILLVDDEELIRDTAKAVLTNAGYRVVTAADGAEAIGCFDAHAAEIALVITDLDMPHLDGTGLARLIHERRPAMKILTMSGAGSARRAHVEHSPAFLAKPFTAEILLSTLAQLLYGKTNPS